MNASRTGREAQILFQWMKSNRGRIKRALSHVTETVFRRMDNTVNNEKPSNKIDRQLKKSGNRWAYSRELRMFVRISGTDKLI